MTNRERLRTVLQLLLVAANICLVVIYVAGSTSSPPQSNKKTVIREPSIVKEPVAITIKHRGRQIKENEAFDGDTDWLKDLTLKLTNTSDKTITYLQIHLIFPETATVEKSSTGLHRIELGVHPDVPLNRAPLILRPGDSTEVTLGNEYADIKKLVEKRVPIDKINQVTLRLHAAMFDDDTQFIAGMLYRRDPNTPHRWIPIEK